MNGFKYRVQLNKSGNSCGLLSSENNINSLSFTKYMKLRWYNDDDLKHFSILTVKTMWFLNLQWNFSYYESVEVKDNLQRSNTNTIAYEI
jgi:hypothetical protein